MNAQGIFTRFIILVILSTSIATSYAQKIQAVNPLEVKYIGYNQDQVLFNASFTNDIGDFCRIIIKDEDDNTLYSDRFSSKSFSRRFAFAKDDLQVKKLHFIIVTSTNQYSEAFEISSSVKLIESLLVMKQ